MDYSGNRGRDYSSTHRRSGQFDDKRSDSRGRGSHNDRGDRGGRRDRSRSPGSSRGRDDKPFRGSSDYSGRGSDYGGGRSFRGGGRGGGGRGDHTVRPKGKDLDVDDKALKHILPTGVPEEAKVDVKVNGYYLDIAKATDVYQYDLQFDGLKVFKDKTEKKIDLVAPQKNKMSKNLKYQALYQIFCLMQEQNKEFFQLQDTKREPLYVYDRSRTFYSDRCLLDEKASREFVVERITKDKYETAEESEAWRMYLRGYERIFITLKRTGYLHNLSEQITTGVPGEISPVLSYLDVLLMQPTFKSNNFHIFTPKLFLKTGSNKRFNNFPLCYDIKNGMSKGTKVVKDNAGKFQILYQMDSKMCAFYNPMKLEDFLRERFRRSINPSDVKKALKGLYVITDHMPAEKNITFAISDVAGEAETIFFQNSDERKTSVADYYMERYRMDVNGVLCVVQKKGSQKSFYPASCLRIIEGQRLEVKQMDKFMNSEMLKMCQQAPAELQENLQRMLENIKIENIDPNMKAAGVRINKRMVGTKGLELYKPAIEYRDSKVELESGSWILDHKLQFVQPANQFDFLVLHSCDRKDAENFVDTLTHNGKDLGMSFGRHNYIKVSHRSNIKDDYYSCREKYNYVLLLNDETSTHHFLKHTELSFNCPTQQVKLQSMKKGAATTKGILMKMNAKAGGINKVLRMSEKMGLNLKVSHDVLKSLMHKTLFIGVELCHPPAQSEFNRMLKLEDRAPSVVGITSNTTDIHMDYGDYFYVPGRSTVINTDMYNEAIKDAVIRYQKTTTHMPNTVMVYRSGISEGQAPEVSTAEVQRVFHALGDVGCNARLIYLTVQRMTNNRIMKADAEPGKSTKDQNVKPGTAVINCLSDNVNFWDYTFVPHISPLGTAKPIQVTFLYPHKKCGQAEQPLTQADFNNYMFLTACLCYASDAVNGPISLPAPMDSASKVAQRGYNNWKIEVNHNDDASSVSSGSRPNTRFQQTLSDEDLKQEEKESLDRLQSNLEKWTLKLRPTGRTAWWT